MFRTILTIAALSLPGVAHAQSNHVDPQSIDRLVADFTGRSAGSPGGAARPVDRRLKLAPCTQPLALEWHGRARENVLVRCPGPSNWRLFVPVRPGEGAQPGPPSAIAIARGDPVTVAVSGRGFTISRLARALEGGAVGEWIRVQPPGRETPPLTVRVVGPGRVAINPPR